MTQFETETQSRLRRAKEALETARERERIAIRALDEAKKSKERAKERYTELFNQEEQEEIARRLMHSPR